MAEKSRRFSPYTYALNNPVYFIDPDGMEADATGGGGMSDQLDVDTELEIDAGTDAGYGRKITASNRTMAVTGNGAMGDFRPDKNGNLIVEKGDNAEKLLKEYGVKVTDKNFKFEEGNVIKLDNNVTRAISRSKGVTSDSGSSAGFDNVNDNYICDECAQMATNNEEITPANATKYGQFPNPISSNRTPGFTEVKSFNNVGFNKGIASIGGQHTVSYYGKSNDGTIYVVSKDGRYFKPQVYSLQKVINKFNSNQGTSFTIKDVTYYKKN